MAIEQKTYLKEVRNQYENYPYPARDPNEEKGVIYSSKASSLDCLNYYCFEGKKDFSKNFRILIPGGGTGDCTIYLAEQLRGTEAEIVYLDMSEASMQLAKERARVRKLDNITWIHESLLNIPQLDIGKFDFITCTGVLHHLTDPQQGLNALKSVLAEDGSIFLMLYGFYGRAAIYPMQDMLRRINRNAKSADEKVKNARTVLASLPKTNLFSMTSELYEKEIRTNIGLYDLLLHSQDRAYTVPELYEYVEASGLSIHKLFNPDSSLGDLAFQPRSFIQDQELLSKVSELPFREQAAICETLLGRTTKQYCYISFKDKTPPSVDQLDLIPNLSVALSWHEASLRQAFSNKQSVQVNEAVAVQPTPHMEVLIAAIDGKRNSREVIERALSNSPQKESTMEQVTEEYKNLFSILVKVGAISLRAAEVPEYTSIPQMVERMHEFYGKKTCDKILSKHYAKNS